MGCQTLQSCHISDHYRYRGYVDIWIIKLCKFNRSEQAIFKAPQNDKSHSHTVPVIVHIWLPVTDQSHSEWPGEICQILSF